MPLASNLTPDSRFMALFVGPKHSGKTVAACSWLKGDKLAKVDDFDGRIKGILACDWIRKDKIDYKYYEPRILDKSSKAFFERLNDELEAMLVGIQSHRSPYSLYLGDSMTALCKNLMIDSVPLTHQQGRGKSIGALNVPDPGDYNFQSVNIDNYLSFLRSMVIDVIVTAHVIPKWDKPRDEKGARMNYADNVIVGEKLSLTDKLGANIPTYFDHIFRFDREVVNGQEKFFVEYISDIACTSFPGLKPGRHDITGKNFRDYTLNLLKTNAVEVKPEESLKA